MSKVFSSIFDKIYENTGRVLQKNLGGFHESNKHTSK